MSSKRILGLAIAAFTLASSAALAATGTPERVRGTIASATADSVTVDTYADKPVTVTLNAQSGTGDASLIYVRGGGGGGGGGGHGGFGGGHGFGGGFGGGHGFGGHDFSGGFGHGHFAGDRGFRGHRDFRGGLWGGDGFCYPGYYSSYDPYFCG